MDLSTLLGIIIGFGMLILGFVLEGGHIGSLFLFAPAVIVFGGTIGALMVSFTLKEVLSIPRLIKESMTLSKNSMEENIEIFIKLAETARKEGLLSLESVIESKESENYDPLLKKGIKLVVDGIELELVKNIMETEIYIMSQGRKTEAQIFEAAGGYSPTMGIIGTVMGLVHVLGNLSSPEELSKSIAGAFIATLYGVCFANIVYLPIASKLKLKLNNDRLQKELIVEGVLSIQAGEAPSVIREKMQSFLVNKKNIKTVNKDE